jgi:ribosomal protein S18 acetylase RimI-like enzyme
LVTVGVDAALIRTAHADAWEAHGRHRTPAGGGAARLPGIRLMASGLSHPQWNNGDVVDPSLVDVEAVRAWYAGCSDMVGRPVPWGVRVRRGEPWPHGRHLFEKRLMALPSADFRPAPQVSGLTLRRATPGDLDTAVDVDAASYGEDAAVMRPWIEPMLDMPGLDYCIAELDGEPVGVGQCLVTDGDAGPAAYIAGIGVLRTARRRGIGAAVSSWLVERGFAAGAAFAHLHPEPMAVGVYERLGFTDVEGFDIYVDL